VTTPPPVTLVAPPVTPEAAPAGLSLDALAPGVSVHGFTPAAIYLDASDKPIGARFIHDKTKFTFEYLRIESAPQGFIWVNSFPTSDKGEPHTQEHLLLGKGDRGRKMGSFQAMALAESSAFTDQWRTAYHFHTVASRDTFWPVFGDQLGALLDPDYTDEEIRREVRNFGVDKADDGTLRLEEKGTVYNEMVRSYEPADAILWRTALRMVYGTKHPLSYESGGYPDDIRTMTPVDIRKFHADNYHLANMGMIGAFPSAMALGSVLDDAGKVLESATQRQGTVTTSASLPKPAPQQVTLTAVDYPYSDTTSPSPMMLVWPATRDIDLADRTLLGLFLDAFAGDQTTTLYKKLIDSKTRTLDLGASTVGAYVNRYQGHPIFLTIGGVRADKLDDATLAKVRTLVVAELARIAQLPAGDPELVAFDQRVQSRVIDLRRQLAKFLDSPPGFGFRGISAGWMDQLEALEHEPGFKKSLTLRPQLAAIEQVLATTGNPWTARIKAWGLLDDPYGIVARPSPKLRAQLDKQRDDRIAAELASLQKHYGTKDKAQTLARYQADYDATTKQLEAAAKAAPLPPLVATPPMTFDDELTYSTAPIGGVPGFTATIDSMQSARVAMAFRLDGVAPDDQMYLALLPTLLSQVGLVDDKGTVLTSEEVRERLRKEILALDVYFAEDAPTRRSELVISGAGNDVAETKLAVQWMGRVMTQADWRIENLPRLRDVVDQALTGLRQTMQGAEEAWVRDPHDAWWLQDWSLHLHTRSFLTQVHDLHRLRWQLLDPRDPKVSQEAVAFLGALASAQTLTRPQLTALAATLAGVPKSKPPLQAGPWIATWSKLSPAAKALALEAGKDLTAMLPDLPDGSLAADWTYLCKQMATDLASGAPAALAKLAAIRTQLVSTAASPRLVVVGATATEQAIAADVAALTKRLAPGTPVPIAPRTARTIAARLHDHDRGTDDATFVGLYAPATSSGVFINNAPATALTDSADDKILDFLTSNLFTGHGAHSLFMKTWAAGLAYSNGAHTNVTQGQIEYYAERCPLLPQTLRFVIGVLDTAQPDPNLARYAIAKAFDSRIAAPYETRAAALAADIVDGRTPEIVRAFRTRVLAQTDRGDLTKQLFDRMPAVYGKVLPGYGKPTRDATNFVIGPAKQLDAYQDYLHGAVGKTTTLHRLYPRDFWIPLEL
jgi:Zn-dependent M16 (insulinase) family peptidase